MLGPLQDNGGPTFTHLPASNSLAIDAGDPDTFMDQRGPGFLRVVNGRVDIGAVEAQATPTPTPTATPRGKGNGHHQDAFRYKAVKWVVWDSAPRCPCVCTNSSINCGTSKIAGGDEKPGGFRPRFPLYWTENTFVRVPKGGTAQM